MTKHSYGRDEIKSYIMDAMRDTIFEEIELEELPEPIISAASLDSQIDKLLMRAEKDANHAAEDEDEYDTSVTAERFMRLSGLMYEAEGDDEDPPVDDDAQQPEGDDEDVDGESETPAPAIDTNEFAEQVARLIDNYENLLDIPSVIVNRAIKFLLKNYDEKTVAEFKKTLSANFDVDLSMQGDYGPDQPQHFAVGALGAGTGTGGVPSMGGGGGSAI